MSKNKASMMPPTQFETHPPRSPSCPLVDAHTQCDLESLRVAGTAHPLRERLDKPPGLVRAHALHLALDLANGAEGQAGDSAAHGRKHDPADAQAAVGLHGEDLLDDLVVLPSQGMAQLLGVAAGVLPDGGEGRHVWVDEEVKV
ncbi:uncharacterized protein PG986_000741 [Apiospora aurea]|uniref:Uncharacterized protein n=1 Tax=Apiospora aurea TaxID=335848 RepID=A0ABR1QV37_9PEZI